MKLYNCAAYIVLCSCFLTGCAFLPHPDAHLQGVDIVRLTGKDGAPQQDDVAIRFSETGQFPYGLYAIAHFCNSSKKADDWKLFVYRLADDQVALKPGYNDYAIFLHVKTPYYPYAEVQPSQYDLSVYPGDICFQTFESGRYFPPFSNTVEIPASSLKAAFARGVISLPASWKLSFQYGP